MTPANRRVVSISAVLAIIATTVGIFAAVRHAGGGMGQVQGNTDRIEIHEGQIHDIEKIVIETNAIVKTIDKRMDREHP